MHIRRPLAALLASSLVVLTGTQACAVLPSDDPARGPATSRPSSPSSSPSSPSERRGSQRADAQSVVAISIDGLNTEALRMLGPARTPHLHGLMASGASTLNARTERELTITLPNHTGMVTGRRVDADSGGHGVTWNDDRRLPATVQAAAGASVESVWTAVHAAGGSTALFASKTKFSLWNRSWPTSIDRTRIQLDNARLVQSVRRDLRDHERAFRFVHLSLPDNVGHARGFMSRAYLRAVRDADALLGLVVSAVAADPVLSGSTAIIVTSDHGGRGAGHSEERRLDNFRVPFVVSGPGVAAGADLYDLNPDYLDPGEGRTGYGQSQQPVRNGDLANLALDFLGLPAVPGSEHNAGLDLDVRPDVAGGRS